MQQLERINQYETAIISALKAWQMGVWTASPGIVAAPPGGGAVVADDGTIWVQPAIKGKLRNVQGQVNDVQITLIPKVPLICFGGGGFSITPPVSVGDEVLVVFGMRCIDGWWQSGGVQSQLEFRMHDPTDAIAIAGLRSKPRALSGFSANSLQIRSDDGDMYLELASGHVMNVVAPGGVNVTAPFIHCSGSIVAGFGGDDQVGLQTHTHTQGNDGHGDAEVATNPPTAGT
jgi:hypothetical protein